MSPVGRFVWFLTILVLCIESCSGISFLLHEKDSQELIADALQDDVVLIEYEYVVETVPDKGYLPTPVYSLDHEVSIAVFDPLGHILYEAIALEEGRAVITASGQGQHRIVISQPAPRQKSRYPIRTRVTLSITVANDVTMTLPDDATEKDHLEKLTRSVTGLRNRVGLIKMEQDNSKAREEKFSGKYSAIGRRVAVFAVVQVALSLGVAAWLVINTRTILMKAKVV